MSDKPNPAILDKNQDSKLLQFKFNESKLRKHLERKPLQSHIPRPDAMDCVVNSFYFTGIINDIVEAEEIAKYYNENKCGVTADVMLNYLYNRLGKPHEIVSYKRIDTMKRIHYKYRNWLTILNDKLKPGHLTILLFTRRRNIGHAIVMYKNDQDKLHVFDPQQRLIITTSVSLVKYFDSNKYTKMGTVVEPFSITPPRDDSLPVPVASNGPGHGKRKRSTQSTKIRKNKNSPPTKKVKAVNDNDMDIVPDPMSISPGPGHGPVHSRREGAG